MRGMNARSILHVIVRRLIPSGLAIVLVLTIIEAA
jgi:hypothetical protein